MGARRVINRRQQLLAMMLMALGALWSAQSAGLVRVKPILCFADCIEVQGPSVQWLVTGLAVIAAGAGLWYFTRRRARSARLTRRVIRTAAIARARCERRPEVDGWRALLRVA
jgi:hypothetical protein